jgi:signal peptidase II
MPQALLVWFVAVAYLQVIVALGAPLGGTGVVGVGLVIGGATGNLADRLARGSFVDFIAVGRWPAFNLADAAMLAGLGLSIVGLL